uniref:Uncharacterized protein n=1 Tax=Plectus sambesii TaxID=2011161 RepID=A0A914UXQ8_9BILA
MSSSQQTTRSIEIPLKDSPDEDAATVRALKDIFVDMYNWSDKWTELNNSGWTLMESIVNERLRLINHAASSNTEVDFDADASRAKMHRHADQVVELLGEMDRIPVKFKTAWERLKSLVKLCKKDSVLQRKAVQAIDLARQMIDMFEKELQCKRATLQDLAETDNRDLLTTAVAIWAHQSFVAVQLFESLFALTVIELDFDNLPEGDEVIGILKQEHAALHIWVKLALEYFKRNNVEDFVRLLEASGSEASLDYTDYERDQMRALDTLAAYYVLEAHKERNKEKKRERFTKATLLYTTADKILMYEQSHLLGRAYFCLLEGDKIDQADAQFNFVINQTPNNIPALLGKACIAFQKKDFKGALFFYKKALKFNPNCPADVRLGMGHCFAKLDKLEKARWAFERTLQLDPRCVGALIGLAILDLNTHTAHAIKAGVQALSRAYNIESHNPMVLNHLANHFFFKKDYSKVQHLALHAFHGTENEAMRAESCYQLARSFHAQRDFDQAFQYYYQATQFATPSFVLPFYGLGQMYINRGDTEHAIQCFEKVLKGQPNNYETMKILGSLYANSETPGVNAGEADSSRKDRRDKAKEYLKKVVEQCPDDVEAWIDYAQLLEESDSKAALDAYMKASDLLQNVVKMDIPPEIVNNIGSLNYSLGHFEEAKNCFEKASEKIRQEIESGVNEYRAIQTTVTYNLARVLETLCAYDEAEKLYKDILRERPSYIDCYLRLGCMARDRGQIYDASVWFKEALGVNQTHPDVWSLIGNLHMSKNEWGPAQKKYEHILKLPESKDDPYSLTALGNVWLETLFISSRDKDKDRRHRDRAKQMFMKALKVQPKNIWAANGIGCVLAQEGYVQEARDIFAQVREATANFADVWLNIAHIYVEQKQYVSAVQMYENCMKKFRKHNDVDLLLYLSRAYFRAEKLNECKNILLKARQVAPHDPVLIFNIAFVLQKLATHILRDDKSNLNQVMGAVSDLKSAERYFTFLSKSVDSGSHNKYVDRHAAAAEARQCSDLLKQATTYVQRARLQDEEEQRLRRRQEDERHALKQRQLEEQQQREEATRRQMEELQQRRQEFIQKTKEILFIPEVPEEDRPKKSRGGGGGGRRRERDREEFVNDSSDMGDWNPGDGGERPPKSKRTKGDKKKSQRRRREKQRDEEIGDDDEEGQQAKEDRKRKRRRESPELSSKQKLKVKSREFLSSSESSSGGEGKAKRSSASEDSDAALPPRITASDSDEKQSPPKQSSGESSDDRKKKSPQKRKRKAAISSDSSDAEAAKSDASDAPAAAATKDSSDDEKASNGSPAAAKNAGSSDDDNRAADRNPSSDESD